MVVMRWPLLPIGLLVVVLSSASAVGIDRWVERSREAELEHAYLRALAADLRADREVLESTSALLEEQLRYADFLSRWAGAEQAGSSATRMEALSEIVEPTRLDVKRDSYDDLLFTGRGDLIRDPRLREDLVTYYAGVPDLPAVGAAEVEALTRFLEVELDAGHWRFWRGENVQGVETIDFRRTSLALRDAGLVGPARTAHRGLASRLSRMDELMTMNDALLAHLDAALAR